MKTALLLTGCLFLAACGTDPKPQVSTPVSVIPVVTSPNAPSALTATAVLETQINLHWTDNSLNEESFRVEHAPDVAGAPGTWTEIASTVTNEVVYAHDELTGGTAHWYRVRARNAAGDSTFTDEAFAITPFPAGPGAIAGGYYHSLFLKEDGTVWTCGSAEVTPIQVAGLAGIVAIATSHSDNLALQDDGTVWTWTGVAGTPAVVAGLSNVTGIARGHSHNVVVRTDGTVWAWGINTNGQLGDGTNANQTSPVQVLTADGITPLTGIVAVAAGQSHNLSAGSSHSLALGADGTVWGWGFNTEGQCGVGAVYPTNVARQVLGPDGVNPLTGIASIAAGGFHSLAVGIDGSAYAWGSNDDGQLGIGTIVDANVARAVLDTDGVSPIGSIKSVGAGLNHSLALKADGTALAWGYNRNGQLGNGTANYNKYMLPAPVLGPDGLALLSDLTAITGGNSHSLAIQADGTVWAWGMNMSGQLGDGTTVPAMLPVQSGIVVD